MKQPFTKFEIKILMWLLSARRKRWVQRYNYGKREQTVLRRFARRGLVLGTTAGAYRLTAKGTRYARATTTPTVFPCRSRVA
jgi:hypothetical protein